MGLIALRYATTGSLRDLARAVRKLAPRTRLAGGGSHGCRGSHARFSLRNTVRAWIAPNGPPVYMRTGWRDGRLSFYPTHTSPFGDWPDSVQPNKPTIPMHGTGPTGRFAHTPGRLAHRSFSGLFAAG